MPGQTLGLDEVALARARIWSMPRCALVGQSRALQRIIAEVYDIGRTGYRNVLIQGESGVGKELVALALQQASTRSGKPFEVFDCPAIPEDHLESEFFGTARGAFPGSIDRRGVLERAHGGTVFLDEIGAMHRSHQAKVLRVMEGKSFRRLGGVRPVNCDVAFIAAAHQDLASMAATGRFRHDLYFRLIQDGIISIPPLRERREDIPALVTHCLRVHAQTLSAHLGPTDLLVEEEALELLRGYHWPGNVRQLFSVVQMAVRFSLGMVTRWGVEEAIRRTEPRRPVDAPELVPRTGDRSRPGAVELSFDSAVRDTRRKLLLEAYRLSGGNKTKAGIALGFHLPPSSGRSSGSAKAISSSQRSLALRRFRYWSFRLGLSFKTLT